MAQATRAVQNRVFAGLTRITRYNVLAPTVLSSQTRPIRREGGATTIEEMSPSACSPAVPASVRPTPR